MKPSPFTYGTTVSTVSFTNRTKDRKKLYDNLLQGVNTSIISPRRWGKSSLVEKVFLSIDRKNKDVKTIIIDLFSVSSEEEFLEVFAREVIKASSNKWQDWVRSGKEFFKQLVPVVNLGVDPTSDFSLSFNWSELLQHKEEILNLPETIAKKKKIQFVIGLDEFQNLATFRNYTILEKNMRAIWQRQKSVTYCLYGSKRHMMSDIFDSPSKPFYRFGDIIMLQKISTKDWVKFIVKSFEKTGKIITLDNANVIPDLMQNHSWYVQQLSHYTWQRCGRRATSKDIMGALTELIQANSPLYQKEVENISGTQLNLLKAVACGETQLTSAKVMRKYRLGTPRNVSKNKKILSHEDIIDLYEGRYEFLDPAFKLWFDHQFFGIDYLS